MRNQLISFFLFSMLSLSAQAEVILSPVSVVSNSMGEGLPLSSPIENVINGSGLSSAFSSGVTPFDSVSATHLFVPPLSWSSQSGSTTGSIVFDLGADYLIEQFALWQGFAPALNANQVASVKLYTTDQLSVANDISSNAWVDVNDGAGTQKEYLVQQGATPPYPMQVFDLEDSTGRYVRLDI